MLTTLTFAYRIAVCVLAALSLRSIGQLIEVHKRVAAALEGFLYDHRREAERLHAERQIRRIRVS